MNLRNKVQLIGHIGNAPEIRTLDSGKTLARFSMATNESYYDANGKEGDIHNAEIALFSYRLKNELQFEVFTYQKLIQKLSHIMITFTISILTFMAVLVEVILNTFHLLLTLLPLFPLLETLIHLLFIQKVLTHLMLYYY